MLQPELLLLMEAMEFDHQSLQQPVYWEMQMK